jgi:outer membrane protein assembly factor BamE (lipoprotein component of BamABCDE complex)
MKKAVFSSVIALMILAGCQPVINSRGNIIVEENMAGFIVGKTTMADVLKKCGTPSLHKDDFTWIYIGSQSEEVAFGSVDLKNRFIVRMQFNVDKILQSLEKINPGESDEITTDEEITNLISDKDVNAKVEKLRYT